MPLSIFSLLLLTLSTFPTTSQAFSNTESFDFHLQRLLSAEVHCGLHLRKQRQFSIVILSNPVNAAMFNNFYNFAVSGATQQDTVYGLFQCRGDLKGGDCSTCVSRAVPQLGTLCVSLCQGALQMDGCFVKCDGTLFFGIEEESSK